MMLINPWEPASNSAARSGVNESDALVLSLRHINTSRESLKLSENAHLELAAIYIQIVCVAVFVFVSQAAAVSDGRAATGEQKAQRWGRACCNVHTHPPTPTHTHISWCINEHTYFLPLRLQCNVQFNGLMFRNGYFMCPGLLCIHQPEAHLIRQLSLIPH